MPTIPSYPAPANPLDGTELVAGFAGGKTVHISTGAVSAFAVDQLVEQNPGNYIDAEGAKAAAVGNEIGAEVDVAPSQAAVQAALIAAAAQVVTEIGAQVNPLVPTIADVALTAYFGITNQTNSLEGGAPNGFVKLSAHDVFFQVVATARDKQVPNKGWAPTDNMRITGLPFSGEGIAPIRLTMESSGLPPDAYAVLDGNALLFMLPGRVPVIGSQVGQMAQGNGDSDDWWVSVSGTLSITALGS